MGRSPFFTLASIERPAPVDGIDDMIAPLQANMRVKFTFVTKRGDEDRLIRSISTYLYEPSPVSNILVYKIVSTDAIPEFTEVGLKVISVISDSHPNPQNHMDGWYITSDGYVRECEHFGIMCMITCVEIL